MLPLLIAAGTGAYLLLHKKKGGTPTSKVLPHESIAQPHDIPSPPAPTRAMTDADRAAIAKFNAALTKANSDVANWLHTPPKTILDDAAALETALGGVADATQAGFFKMTAGIGDQVLGVRALARETATFANPQTYADVLGNRWLPPGDTALKALWIVQAKNKTLPPIQYVRIASGNKWAMYGPGPAGQASSPNGWWVQYPAFATTTWDPKGRIEGHVTPAFVPRIPPDVQATIDKLHKAAADAAVMAENAKKAFQAKLAAEAAAAAARNRHHGLFSSITDAVSSIGDFVSSAAQVMGRAAGSAISAVNSATGAITSAVSKIPVVGGALHAALGVVSEPFKVAQGIASGQRIDRVAMGALNDTMSQVKEVAPYAQTVIGLVPGVGPVVAGGISASLALAQGQSISDALLAGAKGMIPGGAIASAAFDMGTAVAKGQRLDDAALAAATSAAGIPPEAQAALKAALKTTRDIADGKRLDKAVMDQAEKTVTQYLPPEAQKALNIGLAMAHGRRLQDIASEQLAQSNMLNDLSAKGAALANSIPEVKAIRSTIDAAQQKAFDLGTQVTQYAPNLHALQTVRDKLAPDAKKAFDTALAVHIGRVTVKPIQGTPAQQAGHILAHGMRMLPQPQKVAIIKSVAHHPEVMSGIKQAANVIAVQKTSLWEKVLQFLGIHHATA